MKLLIAFDGSELAEAALRDLHRAGMPDQVDVTVLSAADVFSPPGSASEPISPEIAKAMERSRGRIDQAVAQAQALAERAAESLRSEFPKWKVTTKAVADSPAWAILKCSEGSVEGCPKADLVVVGAAGRSAIGRTLFGSVALKVLTNARCSVRIGREARAKSNALQLVVGVDGSPDSAGTVRAIGQRKWPRGTTCHVVTAADAELLALMPGMDPVDVSAPTEMPPKVTELAAAELRKAGLNALEVSREGDAAHVLIEQAEECGADCIFVGARGLRGVERFMLGSVSMAVAMRASCSVEIVRS